MKTHLISGGCGFVGRNMVKRLYKNTEDRILFIDNLSVGKHPSVWLDIPLKKTVNELQIYGEDERLCFIEEDFRVTLDMLLHKPGYLKNAGTVTFCFNKCSRRWKYTRRLHRAMRRLLKGRSKRVAMFSVVTELLNRVKQVRGKQV